MNSIQTIKTNIGRRFVDLHHRFALLQLSTRCKEKLCSAFYRLQICNEEKGQGTTEYAILVGVLVLIAIIAVIAFRERIQELWTSIADGINGL